MLRKVSILDTGKIAFFQALITYLWHKQTIVGCRAWGDKKVTKPENNVIEYNYYVSRKRQFRSVNMWKVNVGNMNNT
jgi:hypothetical protein